MNAQGGYEAIAKVNMKYHTAPVGIPTIVFIASVVCMYAASGQAEAWDWLPFYSDDGALASNRPWERNWRNPLEILLVFSIVAAIILSALKFVAGRVKQPMVISVTPTVFPELTEYMEQTTAKLRELGFSPRLDFTVTELPHPGMYRLLSLQNNRCMVMIMQIESAGQSKMMKQYVSLIEFKTVLDNGREILTNNSPVSHPLSKQPHIQLFRRSEIQDERELLFHHIKDVEVVRDRFGGSPVEQSPETFQTDFPAQWEREMAYQIKTGRLSTSDKTGELKGTLPLVLHAVTPSGNSFAWFLTVPAACALIVGILAIPGITIALTSGESPHVQALLEALLEALLITGICGAAGYSAGSGGFAMGLLTWFPSMLLLVSGPVGWIIPPVLAFNAGQLGEKLSKLPGPVGVPFHRLVRPEIWLIPFLIAAGCVI